MGNKGHGVYLDVTCQNSNPGITPFLLCALPPVSAEMKRSPWLPLRSPHACCSGHSKRMQQPGTTPKQGSSFTTLWMLQVRDQSTEAQRDRVFTSGLLYCPPIYALSASWKRSKFPLRSLRWTIPLPVGCLFPNNLI